MVTPPGRDLGPQTVSHCLGRVCGRQGCVPRGRQTEGRGHRPWSDGLLLPRPRGQALAPASHTHTRLRLATRPTVLTPRAAPEPVAWP